MDRELQEYYEERFSMCSSKGWRQLIEDVKEMKEATDTLKGADTIESLFFKKGEVSIMDWLLSLEDSSREVYDQLQEESESE